MTTAARPIVSAGPQPRTQNDGAAPAPRVPRAMPHAGVRYSRFVQLTKLLAATVALVLVALVVIWPQFSSRDGGLPLGIAPSGREDAESLHMVSPRYTGLDQNNLPYEVTADLASQETAKSDLIALDNPKADMTMKDGTWMALSANSGLYGQKSQQLDLSGEVNLFHDSGYEFTSKTATIDLNTGAGHGSDPTFGHGPAGEIEGEGFRFTDKGKTIVFTGKSHLTLYPGTAEPKPEPKSEAKPEPKAETDKPATPPAGAKP
jgi:lipopolysaccharide export system protein LptC